MFLRFLRIQKIQNFFLLFFLIFLLGSCSGQKDSSSSSSGGSSNSSGDTQLAPTGSLSGQITLEGTANPEGIMVYLLGTNYVAMT